MAPLFFKKGLFSAEVGGDFPPSVGVPFEDGISEGMGIEPSEGSLDKVADSCVFG